MMPILNATPPRPDVAIATPPEAAADAASSGTGAFARVLRDAEAPDASAKSAAEPVAARSTRNPAARERTGSDRIRPGDTPDAAGAPGSGAAPATSDATETSKAGARASATLHDTEENRVLAETVGAAPTATDTAVPMLDAQAMALPAMPPARVALDRPAPHESDGLAGPATEGGAAGRDTSGPVGSRAIAGRHPLAVADSRSGTAHGAAMPALPGEARARVDERGADPKLVGPAMPATASTTEPPAPSLTAGTTPELTASLPWPMGAVPLALERLAGHPADLARPGAEVRLTAELGSPAFTQALGTQMGVWMRDGVQEARIQLNPAELGPLQIQIALDGQSAQVDFHAAHARTREAIEASLPALASALRESGFTLAGGGVFGQGAGDSSARTPPRPPHDERNPRGPDAVAASGDEGLVAAAERSRSWRRGLLDVFA